jgi:hypothetical protein
VSSGEVTEYAARTIDGDVVIRSTAGEDPKYPAARWARDQQALGSRVQRRRIIVVEDWAEVPQDMGG